MDKHINMNRFVCSQKYSLHTRTNFFFVVLFGASALFFLAFWLRLYFKD